ncbi:hypothetical protein QFZ81_000774 [Paenibacillus sp. V4I9]|uniref:hypothetical protein n=1 Tax=Paenibacillus sp. V4I9 TaxID=3042308 RepID=UPI00278725CF|nr:hypothetical protein [Paenibacillus sp. V4I9]MDQ0885686.1 hypothetical protein [Paenibacillus sp. V4I9]
MNHTTLQFDIDFENAIFFGYYVMVVTDEKASGGGLIESYDEKYVWINGRQHLRTQSSFIHLPPPEVHMIFPN